MADKTIKKIHTVNCVYFGIFANVVGFATFILLITPMGDDGGYASISNAEDTVLFFKAHQYGYIIVLVASAAIWYLMDLILYSVFGKTLVDETKMNVKSIVLPAAVFSVNSVSTLWLGSDIYNHAVQFRTIVFGERDYSPIRIIESYMTKAQKFLIFAAIIPVIEIALWIFLYYVKKPMPKYCLVMCGCSILPYMSLLYTINY